MQGLEDAGRDDCLAASIGRRDPFGLGLDMCEENFSFDASQYSFFAKNSMEGVELRGIEDDSHADVLFDGADGRQYNFPSVEGREGVDGFSSLSDIDDLASTFAKLNRTVSGTRNPGVIGDRRSISRESSSTIDWTQDGEYPTSLVDHSTIYSENTSDSERWSSQLSYSPQLGESRPLHRTITYPQQQLQHSSTDPILPSKSSFTSYPPPGGGRQAPQGLTRHASIPSLDLGLQMPISVTSPVSATAAFHLSRLPHRLPYVGNQPFAASSDWVHGLAGEHAVFYPNMLPQHSPHLSSSMRALLLAQQHQQQQWLPHIQPSQHNYLHMAPDLLYGSAEMANRVGSFTTMPGLREHRSKSSKGRQNVRLSHQPSDISSQKSDGEGLKFRSKYMSSEDIETVLKLQRSATHSSDPYVEDYYHQACIAKRYSGPQQQNPFHPVSIKDSPSKSRGGEQHSCIQVDALGRVSFSSIRMPRPLLEVDNPSASNKVTRPLEKEPLLAARITIEECFGVLLDVDDINRMLQSSQGGSHTQLSHRRQVLLEGLAMSLHLVDPLFPNKPGSAGISLKDDLVFLRLVALPKGRKLFTRYLRLLAPGGDLARIVCMAIFRHLRYLFGGLPSDPYAAEATTMLAKTVATCIGRMDLSSISACLAAVVCSSEQPPLRSFGCAAGDGASVIVKSILDRATELLTDAHVAPSCTVPSRTLWQASFDSFFRLLTKYCLSKHESIVQMLRNQVSSAADIGAEAAAATSKEMPVELLRSSLPHTNEQQRKTLLDFAQKFMQVSAVNPPSGAEEQVRLVRIRP